MSTQPGQSHEPTEGNKPLPLYHDTSKATSRTPPRYLGCFGRIVLLLGIAATLFLTLNLFFHGGPDRDLQFSPTRNKTLLDLEHHMTQHTHWARHEADHTLANSSSSPSPMSQEPSLTRRQGKGSQYQFQIPLTSAQFQFLSQGSIDRSAIKIMRYNSPKKFVLVKVLVTKDPKKVAKVVTLPVTGGGPVKGIKISAPTQPAAVKASWPAFSVVVYFPFTPEQRLRLGSLETMLPQFDHDIGDLAKSFTFSRISTRTSFARMQFGSIATNNLQVSNTNGPITFGVVSAGEAKISTTNRMISIYSMKAQSVSLSNRIAPITGSITATQQLVISNLNSKIDGEFTLVQQGTARFMTKNAPITGKLRLKAIDRLRVPSFSIQAYTTNFPVNLKIYEQPISSACRIQASSNLGVQIWTAAAFEGSFRIETKQNRPVVQVKNTVDPTGQGRKRLLVFTKPSKALGYVTWGDHPLARSLGHIWISTTKGPAQLFFN